jgi:hypothetical protein
MTAWQAVEVACLAYNPAKILQVLPPRRLKTGVNHCYIATNKKMQAGKGTILRLRKELRLQISD